MCYMPVNMFWSCTSSSMDMNPQQTFSYSGISIEKFWVLAHGSTLAPVLSRSRKLVHLLSTSRPGDLTIVEASELNIPADHLSLRIRCDDLSEDRGKVVAFWICPLVKETLDNSFEGCTLEKQHAVFCRLLLPVFLLIKRESAVSMNGGASEEKKRWETVRKEEREESVVTDQEEIVQVLRQVAKETAVIGGGLKKGTVVELISTPFGNVFFRDSVSRGIIGNLLGTEECLILLDVAAFPGSEGSPLFVINDRWPPPRPTTTTTGGLEKSVAMVKCGPNWGTGVLLDEQSGTFVTCAHVVTMVAPRIIVQLATTSNSTRSSSCKQGGGFEWFAEASLIYKTPDDQPYDIALLRIDSKFGKAPMKAIQLADKPAREGEQVLAIGFPFSAKITSPTITSGIVSKTSSYMFQTNCCIQRGVSGGAIVRRSNFQMLGLIVCNVASPNGSISYPRLCMAIPITVLKGPLNNYLRTADPETLQDLAPRDRNVSATWNLRPFLPSSI